MNPRLRLGQSAIGKYDLTFTKQNEGSLYTVYHRLGLDLGLPILGFSTNRNYSTDSLLVLEHFFRRRRWGVYLFSNIYLASPAELQTFIWLRRRSFKHLFGFAGGASNVYLASPAELQTTLALLFQPTMRTSTRIVRLLILRHRYPRYGRRSTLNESRR